MKMCRIWHEDSKIWVSILRVQPLCRVFSVDKHWWMENILEEENVVLLEDDLVEDNNFDDWWRTQQKECHL